MIIIIFLLVVAVVVFHQLYQEGLIRAWEGPNNNLGCIPIIIVFVFTIFVLTQL